jgi:hypothetical protein
MNPLHELFEKYSTGILDETSIDTLHRQLLEAYFDSPDELNREELEYAEDLAFDLYTQSQLNANHATKFSARISGSPSLRKKYALHKNLMESTRNSREKRARRLTAAGALEDQEEEHLKDILQEVIRKVEEEREKSSANAWVEKLRLWLADFLEEANLWIGFHRGNVRLVLAFASIALLAGVAWMIFRPGDKVTMVATEPGKPAKSDQMVAVETPPVKEPNVTIKAAAAEKVKHLIISMFEFEKSFDYSLLRGEETTPAGDAFIKAADHYNLKQYDSCIRILKELTDKKLFTDRDTISEIYFYLGNCYLIKGMTQNNPRLIHLSLQSFESVGRQSYYFKPSWWYRVFANAKIGNMEASANYLDSLVLGKSGRYGKVKAMRDSIRKINELQ